MLKVTATFALTLFLSHPLHCQEENWKGLAHRTNVSGLRDLFPRSSHEFWESGSGRVAPASDKNVDFDFLLRSGSGRYIIRLSPEDSFDHVYYIETLIDRGHIFYLRLSFERPAELLAEIPPTWEADHRARHPPCHRPRLKLLSRFGQPSKKELIAVERIIERKETFTSRYGLIELMCYQLDGAENWLAAEVRFVGASSTSNR